METDAAGRVVSTGLRDVFYNVVYKWSQIFIDPASFASGRTGEYAAGTIRAAKPDGSVIETTVYLKPTVYAGQRDFIRPGDRGEWLFRGEPIELDPNLLLPSRDEDSDEDEREEKRRQLWELLGQESSD